MTAKDVLTLAISTVVAAIALATLVKACMEYVRQGRLSRAQMFFDLRQRLKQQPLAKLAQWIDEATCGDPVVAAAAREKLLRAPLRTKRDYLGLFEEVEIAMRSRLIKPKIASYMFGYYALRCADCEPFWHGVNKANPYWKRFFRFCNEMRMEEAKLIGREPRDVVVDALAPAAPAGLVGAVADAGERTVAVLIPPVFRAHADGRKTVDVPGATVGEVLQRLVVRYPSMRFHLFAPSDADETRPSLQRYINVYLGEEDVRFLDGLDTETTADLRVTFLPSAAGG